MDCPAQKTELPTPCLILDLELAEENIAAMQAAVDRARAKMDQTADLARYISGCPGLRLLSTVVSANHDKFVTVDAGLKALYRLGHPRGLPARARLVRFMTGLVTNMG